MFRAIHRVARMLWNRSEQTGPGAIINAFFLRSATHMDEQVIAAMARWPNVPAVYGWLSLTGSGQWRLHPGGEALRHPESPGEAITSPQILSFIERNYEADTLGQWYFQNGPQRVYVRLDAAPYLIHTTTDAATGRLLLRTHTGLDIRAVQALYLDDTGRLYAATDLGPGLIAGRDLPALLDAFQVINPPAATADHSAQETSQQYAHVQEALVQCLETGATVVLLANGILGFPPHGLPLHPCQGSKLEATLGFRRLPQPPEGADDAQPPQERPDR